ncbi:fibronectin type III domain-containing protein [Saccharopolyspora taberi]|uniref:Fibronectin type-III domain-containing protein n=1 Tax=Saccharopolyspora taberi TaxID=60895 RepID=A0ABN3V1W0_9PSEU
MSTHIDSSKARLWLDGDAFRAPAGTPLPTNIWADTLPGWDAFGGIKAGFEIETERETTPLDVWNNTSGAAYRNKKDPAKPTIKLRPVDYSNATVLTLLTGGSISETSTGSGMWEWIEGDDPEFATILRLVDGDKKKAYFVERGELANIPTETMNAEDLEGWDLEVAPLAPASGNKAVRRFTSWNPLSGASGDTIAPTAPTNLAAGTITANSVALTWTASTDAVGVVSYDVFANGLLRTTSSTTSATVSGLTASTSYSFYVRARDAALNSSAASNVVTVSTTA